MNKATSRVRILPAIFVVLTVACSPRESPKQAGKTSNSRTVSPSPQSEPIQASLASVRVTKAQYGEDWPFTVDEGVLACENIKGDKTVTLTANGITYIVNSLPKGTETRGNKKFVRILGAIWAKNPKGPAPYKPIGAIIDRGLSLCR